MIFQPNNHAIQMETVTINRKRWAKLKLKRQEAMEKTLQWWYIPTSDILRPTNFLSNPKWIPTNRTILGTINHSKWSAHLGTRTRGTRLEILWTILILMQNIKVGNTQFRGWLYIFKVIICVTVAAVIWIRWGGGVAYTFLCRDAAAHGWLLEG